MFSKHPARHAPGLDDIVAIVDRFIKLIASIPRVLIRAGEGQLHRVVLLAHHIPADTRTRLIAEADVPPVVGFDQRHEIGIHTAQRMQVDKVVGDHIVFGEYIPRATILIVVARTHAPPRVGMRHFKPLQQQRAGNIAVQYRTGSIEFQLPVDAIALIELGSCRVRQTAQQDDTQNKFLHD